MFVEHLVQETFHFDPWLMGGSGRLESSGILRLWLRWVGRTQQAQEQIHTRRPPPVQDIFSKPKLWWCLSKFYTYCQIRYVFLYIAKPSLLVTSSDCYVNSQGSRYWSKVYSTSALEGNRIPGETMPVSVPSMFTSLRMQQFLKNTPFLGHSRLSQLVVLKKFLEKFLWL